MSALYSRRGPARFSFLEVVLSIVAEPSEASGGALVTVVGAGFDPSAGPDYLCFFSAAIDSNAADDGSDGMLSDAVTAQTSADVVCAIPAWGRAHAAGPVAVELLRGAGAGAMVPWVRPMAPEVMLLETWTAAGLGGGLALNATVTAFGNCHLVSDHFCEFSTNIFYMLIGQHVS